MVFRNQDGEMPLYIQNVFKSLTSIIERVTRQTMRIDLFVPQFKLNLARFSMSYYGPTLYSKTSEIRTVPSEQCPDLRIIRISEFNLVSHAKSGKGIIMGPYMVAGSIPYRAQFVHDFWSLSVSSC